MLVAVSATTVGLLWLDGYRLSPVWAVLVLGAIAALAEWQSVFVTERMQASVSLLPLIFSAVAFGPLGGLAVGAISNIADLRDCFVVGAGSNASGLRQPSPRLKWTVYTAIRGLTAASAGLAAATFAHGAGFGQSLLASLVASVTYLVAEELFVGATVIVRRGSARELQTQSSVNLLTVPLYVPVLALFVYGFHAYSLGLVLVFFAPALAAQRLLNLYQQEKEAARNLEDINERLRRANLSFAKSLVATLEARDRYTAGHSGVVAYYARDIAARMGLPEEERDLVFLCGLVHDIGKIGIKAGVLEKPGPLTLEERKEMQLHSEIGESILRNVDDYSKIARIVRHHHERIDGEGYPDGLHGDDVPLLARIICVADAYNAMTSDRPYRDALPSRVARLRLAQAVDSQFDTSVVAAFEAVLAGEDEEYRMGVSERFLQDWHSAAAPPDALPLVAAAANA